MMRYRIHSRKNTFRITGLIFLSFFLLSVSVLSRYVSAQTWVKEYTPTERVSMLNYLKEVYQKGNIYDRNDVLIRKGDRWEVAEGQRMAFQNLVGEDIEKTFSSLYTLNGRFGNYLYGMESNYFKPALALESKREGGHLTLTIDVDKQELCWNLLKNYANNGEILVMNYQTGEILVAVSNKETQYHSCFFELKNTGSTIKPLLASILLEHQLDQIEYLCLPTTEQGISCYNGAMHGEVTLSEALQVSCNKYFISAASQLPLSEWEAGMKKFGFDVVENDAASLAYSDSIFYETEEKEEKTEETKESMPYLSFIGQENCKATLYGICKAYMPFYHQGILTEPRICKAYQVNAKETKTDTEQKTEQILSAEHAEQMKQMLRANVTDGICKNFEVQGMQIGGKTGTADTDDGKEILWAIGGSDCEETPYIVGVCLSGQPKGSSSAVAGLLLKQVFEQFK